jgi:hypothetical protein
MFNPNHSITERKINTKEVQVLNNVSTMTLYADSTDA